MTTPITVAVVNMTIANNETWQFAFQFGAVGDTSWSFVDKDLYCDVKQAAGDDTPLLSMSSLLSPDNDLIIRDPVARLMQFNVAPNVVRNQLPVQSTKGTDYVYDLIMVDQVIDNTQRLMTGIVTVINGVTREP
jgi:hypothetical protein